ncbi:Hypothetical predicted protein [Mytilus galloprovincialis]|uniref:Myb/SANT-like DNA-binding domain-containing protein n=1 Tax=Mytilus galloprovincialis TaxID=29158 RepID=A0A8B6HCV2_MYTGA|nr:Hypothetical predicted protein [Mytilus galloprovincialis]
MSTPRRPNFMKDELKALTDGIHQRQKLLFSSFNNTDTHLAKERGWQQIVEEVNAVSQVKRSKEEIKRKWTYIKSETKKKNSQHKRSLNKTGGGPVDLSTERVVLGILGPTAINGISGGIETTDLPNVNERGDTAVSCVHQIAFPEETVTINNNESPKITYIPAKPGQFHNL